MSAAHYMVSIKTDMPKTTRPEDLNGSNGTVAKKKKVSDGNIEFLRLQTLQNGSTNVTNKKERFDTSVRELANNYKREPLKSETEKNQEKRVIKWIGLYLNAILDLMKDTKKFKLWDSKAPLPKQFDKYLPEPSAKQMQNWATRKPEDDNELDEEEDVLQNPDDESDVESDEEDEFAIDAIKRDGGGQILYSFNNFEFLVRKLIRDLNEEGEEDISEDELEFLSTVFNKYEKFYTKSLVKMLQDPIDGLQPRIEELLESRTIKDIIKKLLSIWNKDEYILKLLTDLNLSTEDTSVVDNERLRKTKKELEDKRLATFLAKKAIEDALTAQDVEAGLTPKDLRRRDKARRELAELGISSLEAQPEAMEGDRTRKSSRNSKPIDRLQGTPFEVPLASLDTGIRKIETRLSELREMKHFLESVDVDDQSPLLAKKMNGELIPKWKRELVEMGRWGELRIRSREERYRIQAELLQAQHSQRSELKYIRDMTRFFLFKKIDGCWVDISGKAENARHYVSLLFDSWDKISSENSVLTRNKDYVKAKGLVISIPRDHLDAMGLKTPGEKKIVRMTGYSITNCPRKDENCLMTIDDPDLFNVQRVSELYLTKKKRLHELGLLTPVGYEMTVGEGYRVWESHRSNPGSYWINIENRSLFNPLDLKKLNAKLNCRGLESMDLSRADSGDEADSNDEEDNPVLAVGLLRNKMEILAAQRLDEEKGELDEQQRALNEEKRALAKIALENLIKKWKAQREPFDESEVESFPRYRSPEFIFSKNLDDWEIHCRREGLDENFLEVVREILKKKYSPTLVLRDQGIGRILSDKDGDHFIPSWNDALAGPALQSCLEQLKKDEVTAHLESVSLIQDEDEEHERRQIEALEEDEWEAIEASEFAIERQKIRAHLEKIERNIKILEGKGGLSPNNSESLRQLTMERDELAQLETIIRNRHNAYRRKRKQRDEEERQDLHDQKNLRKELQRLHREEAEEEIILHPQDATEEAFRRRILLKRYRKTLDERHQTPKRGREILSNADRRQSQGESLVPRHGPSSTMISSIEERLQNLEREMEMQSTAAKVKAGAAGASGKPRDDGPQQLAGMFSQKLDEDLNGVRLCFLSLEP
jgi:hypothetical protein